MQRAVWNAQKDIRRTLAWMHGITHQDGHDGPQAIHSRCDVRHDTRNGRFLLGVQTKSSREVVVGKAMGAMGVWEMVAVC